MICRHLTGWLMAGALLLSGAACLDTAGPAFNGGVAVDTVAFQSVEAGGAHSCGIVEDGVAYCWGNNDFGQLGTGNLQGYAFPRQVAQGDLEFTSVAAGVVTSCAITIDQEVYCWGYNQYGQVGDGTVDQVLVANPTKVVGDHQFTMVSAGGAHVCGLVNDGEAWCWGLAGSGVLGNDSAGEDTWSAAPDSALTAERFGSISAGPGHTCGLTLSGEAYCWGDNTRGQLGDGTNVNADVPIKVVGGVLFQEIDVGADHTCALDIEGNAYCWGAGFYGQLGNADQIASDTPVMVTGDHKFQSITAGTNYTCAVDDGSVAYCWGYNEDGRLGDGSLTGRNEPTVVSGDLEFETVDAGEGSPNTATCGFTLTGSVYCWGHGLLGQLGGGQLSSSSVPVKVAGQL
jgi:hypothetical protein